MTTANFLIGPVSEGLRKDVKPWAIPEDSFETLTNAYQFRGRIVKRQGYTLLGNLANGTPVMGLRTQEEFSIGQQNLIAFDTTNAYLFNGTTFVALPSVMPTVWSGTDSNFFWSINYANAFWATNSKKGLHGFAVTAFAGAAGAGLGATVQVTSAGNTFQVNDYVYFLNVTGGAAANNLTYGQVTVAGNPFTITSLNSDPAFAFVNGPAATGIALSTSRSVAGQDGIRYYGILTNGTGWANYNPPIDPNNALAGALLIFAYRGYLVFLNTWEGNEANVFQYGNRARWTQIGTPYYSLPTPQTPNPFTYDPKAARDDLFGRGGANDAPTNEVIVAAGFIRDILVVYFERSTWRLRFVNNAQNPFVWERVNVELGSDCTFSAIPFDKGLMAIGNRGIVISDANDTSRFDEKIPDDIFDIRQNNNGLLRVQGIRSFRTRLNYWTFPDASNVNGVYPDKVLVFNYETKNWSFFDDCFTCFGYFYPASAGYIWNDLDQPWSTYNNLTAADGVTQEGYETLVAGNQQGFVFKLEQTSGTNDPSLNISNIVGSTVTSTNHNLPDGSWIRITGVTGTTSSDGVSLNNRNFKISNPTQDANNFTLTEFSPVNGGLANGSSYSFSNNYTTVLPGSVQINVGALQFTDRDLDGILFGSDGLSTGTIDYSTGNITLAFAVPVVSTQVWIRVVSLDRDQLIVLVSTTGAYTGGGQIAKISGIDIQTKIFNFLKDDKRSRLSKIDFYTDLTENGQFTVNVFADSSNVPVNTPLRDNPQSNVVLTSQNPYQIGSGSETFYRLYCDAIAQTVQLQIIYSDQQMAVQAINSEDIQLLALMFSLRRGGRLV